MKVTFNIECSPEEARAFLGLPDVSVMQEHFMADLEKTVRDNLRAMNPDAILKTWMPTGVQNIEQVQKLFWSQMQQTMAGMADSATSAMTSFAEQSQGSGSKKTKPGT